MRNISRAQSRVRVYSAMDPDKAQGETRRTLFVRNLPYSTSDDHLLKSMAPSSPVSP